MNYNNLEINLKDLLAECLIRWKLIILAAIACCALGVGYAAYKNTFDSYDRQVAAAQEGMEEDEIGRVNALYAEYAANIALQNRIVENASRSAVMRMDAESAAIRRSMYVIETDQDYLVNNLESFILDDAFYAAAAEILGDDTQAAYLSGLFTMWKGSTGESGDSIVVKTTARNTSVYYLQAIGTSEETADALLDLMEERLEAAVSDMQDVDADIQVTSLGRSSVQVSADMITDLQTGVINSMTSEITQLQAANKRTIEPALSEREQIYYDLLTADADVKEETTSYVKFAVLGGAGGAFLVIAWGILQLLLRNNKVRSLTEIASVTGMPTLAVYDNRVGSKDPIVNYGMRLQSGETAIRDAAGYESILLTRVQALMSQNHCQHLYVIDTQDTLLPSGEVTVSYGIPQQSAEGIRQFLASDGVICVTRIGVTETSVLSDAMDLCKVHNKRILGNVVIY